jgi:hypothetical protein
LSAIDDAICRAFAGVLADERKDTTAGFLLRALRWFRDQGSGAEWVVRLWSGRFLGIRRIFRRPCIPGTSRKAGRLIRTLLRECAYGLDHPSSLARNAGLQR